MFDVGCSMFNSEKRTSNTQHRTSNEGKGAHRFRPSHRDRHAHHISALSRAAGDFRDLNLEIALRTQRASAGVTHCGTFGTSIWNDASQLPAPSGVEVRRNWPIGHFRTCAISSDPDFQRARAAKPLAARKSVSTTNRGAAQNGAQKRSAFFENPSSRLESTKIICWESDFCV